MTDSTRPAPIRLAPPLAGPAIAVIAAIAAIGGCSSDGADGPSSGGNAGAAPALGHGGDSP